MTVLKEQEKARQQHLKEMKGAGKVMLWDKETFVRDGVKFAAVGIHRDKGQSIKNLV